MLAKNRSLPARGHADSSDDELVGDGELLGEWSCGRWSLERGTFCCVGVGRGRGRAYGFVRSCLALGIELGGHVRFAHPAGGDEFVVDAKKVIKSDTQVMR